VRGEVLERYSVDGVVWGRKSAWFDARGNLVATVSGDAELDRMEVIREGYEAGMPVFVAGSVRDGLADLARVAARVKPVQPGHLRHRGGAADRRHRARARGALGGGGERRPDRRRGS
jgi:hypothetical protein